MKRKASFSILNAVKKLAQSMFWGFISLELDPQYLAALKASTSLLDEIKEMIAPDMEDSAAMLLVAHASITGMMFL